MGEAVRNVLRWPHLSRTGTITIVVGTILFVINHLDTVLAEEATTTSWIKTCLTYIVPFVVAKLGLLLG